jgi:hypothetical protein
MKVASSRATAAQATGASFPRAISCRYRPHNLTWAFQAMSRMALSVAVSFGSFFLVIRAGNR